MRRHVLTVGAMVISGVFLTLMLTLGSAHAFTETPVQGAGQQQAPAAPAQPGGGAAAPGANGGAAPGTSGVELSLTDPSAAAGKSSEGTEVKIPGIGTVGTLPKLDFGLELLYGANSEGPLPEKPTQGSDDVLIRGTLKHRF